MQKGVRVAWISAKRASGASAHLIHHPLYGIEVHVCVWQTAATLLREDYSVQLIADATSSRSAFNRDIAFRRMERAGAHLSNVEMVLFELMVNAKHPKFRDVTKLLK